MSELFGNGAPPDVETYELIEELELNRPEDIRDTRERIAVQVRARITVRPADLCDRDRLVAEGHTREIQKLSIGCVVPTPIPVGSVFHLEFDRNLVDLPPLFAICDRCTLLKDDAIEVRFQPLQAIDLKGIQGTVREI